SRRAHVDLPSPVAPTRPTCSPAATRNVQSRRTYASPSYANQTLWNSMAGTEDRGSGTTDRASGATIVGSRSSSPKILSADAMADCITVYLAPRSRMGRKKRLVYWMKATSAPNVSAPAPIWPPPYQISRASATAPSASTEEYSEASKTVELKSARR